MFLPIFKINRQNARLQSWDTYIHRVIINGMYYSGIVQLLESILAVIYLGLLFLFCNFGSVFVAFQEPYDTTNTLFTFKKPSQQFACICMGFFRWDANFCLVLTIMMQVPISKDAYCYEYVFFWLYSICSSIYLS